MNVQKFAACILEKHAFTNDNECIVADPRADILDIKAVVNKTYEHVFNTEKIQLKYVCLGTSDEHDNEYRYEYQYVLKDQIHSSNCPPQEIRTLLEYCDDQKLYTIIVEFANYCKDRAADAAAAIAAATAARYAAAAAAARYARYATAAAAAARYATAAAADAAAAAADAAAARQDEYNHLCVKLREMCPEVNQYV